MKEDRRLLSDGTLTCHQTLSFLGLGLGGNLLVVGVSPITDPVTTLGFLD